eukprot:scaffold14000_cov135-Isochrysis_galbana.AAC.10
MREKLQLSTDRSPHPRALTSELFRGTAEEDYAIVGPSSREEDFARACVSAPHGGTERHHHVSTASAAKHSELCERSADVVDAHRQYWSCARSGAVIVKGKRAIGPANAHEPPSWQRIPYAHRRGHAYTATSGQQQLLPVVSGQEQRATRFAGLGQCIPSAHQPLAARTFKVAPLLHNTPMMSQQQLLARESK